MRKRLLLVLALSLSMFGHAQIQNQAYLEYIEQWKDVALQNQKDYGIPASIIMAQALLESGAGRSELALKAKNHFGIKCTSEWMGGVYYYDDDRKHECFRQYRDAAESFKDHALFLQRPRYATCFEIAVEDYEGWARRLKECGYATDPNYAPKLIKIIEDYGLDRLAVRSAAPVGPSSTVRSSATVRPAAPIGEIVVPLTAKEEKEQFFLNHPKKRFNGVSYVDAREGDTYANVAFRLNVRERELREDNDALGRELKVGDRIYLGAKKTTGANVYVWSFPGLSLWQLCQEEAVQMEAVRKLNELDPRVQTFTSRQRIYLRKTKDDEKR